MSASSQVIVFVIALAAFVASALIAFTQRAHAMALASCGLGLVVLVWLVTAVKAA